MDNSAAPTSPFVVPPFQLPPPASITYVWWSWHPRYPQWSQSCWKACSIEAAQKHLQNPITKLRYYHNKLILHDGITCTEVQDAPCECMDVWRDIKAQMEEEEEEENAATRT